MRSVALLHAQRGATLVVGLIMLLLITVMVTSAFTLSTTNLQSVGNMQFRDDAIAAANKATEQVLSSPFTSAPAAETINVDLNNDGTTDYTVDFDAPACVSANVIVIPGSAPSSVTLPAGFGLPASTFYQTVWDLSARVTDPVSGASVHVRQGVRAPPLTQAQYDAACP
jgi:Tfp pilus assembly protein PilV